MAKTKTKKRRTTKKTTTRARKTASTTALVVAQKPPAKSTRLVPSKEPIFPDISQGFSSIVQVAHNVLQNPDIAFRTDRRMSDQMIRDPMVLGPLQKRMLATAQLDWQIVPPDDKDPFQVEVADKLDSLIRPTPRLIDHFMDLLWAIFRGTGASELYWAQTDFSNDWIVESHRPHHGDKIVYDVDGNPRILTRNAQTGGRELNDAERDRLVIHTHDREDGTFFEPAEAAYVFKGRGIRDAIWPYWWLKHNALRFWIEFMERFGGGFITGQYPMGNQRAKKAMEEVLKNLINNSKVSIPIPTNTKDREAYGITVHNIAGNRGTTEMFRDFVDGWAGKHIRILIVGEEQAQQEGGDGLGSGRAKALENIFKMYREYDAHSLASTLTHTVVERFQRFNFGVLPFQCRFEFVLDSGVDRDTTTLVQELRLAGIPVPKNWLYGELGVPIPTEDDEVVDFGAQQLGAGGFDPGGMSDFMGFSSRPAHQILHRAGRRATRSVDNGD